MTGDDDSPNSDPPTDGVAPDDPLAGTLTWHELWVDTTRRLGGNAQHARWLCEDASGFGVDEWATERNQRVGARAIATLDRMVERLSRGEPLQYVLGHWSFRRLDLMIDRRVLIPRSETELLVEMAIAKLAEMPQPWTVADLGTGSGAIALALADELPLGAAVIWATDVSIDALDVARANLAGLGRAATAVRLAEGSWWSALDSDLLGTFDVIVSNPPYIAIGDPQVEAVVSDWEPSAALFSGEDGGDALATIVRGAMHWLRPGGWLLCEIGSGQGALAASLAAHAGLAEISIHPDLAGRDRILAARRAFDAG